MTTHTARIRLADLGTPLDRLPDPGTVDVTVEVIGAELGDQLQAERLPWHGVIYDSGNDILEVSLGRRDRVASGQLRHAVHAPTVLWLEERDGVANALCIESAGGPQTIVRFHRRYALGNNPGPDAPLSQT